uniref:C-type lectin domain family 4 member F n=1 Tax=Loxodonta africana TaxID=9785 RepID=G3U0J7_LOXAF
MKEGEMNGDKAYFCTDNQCVSLHPRGMDSDAVGPAAPKMPRLAQAALVFLAVIIVSFLVAFIVVELPYLQRSNKDEPKESMLGAGLNLSISSTPGPYHSARVADVQEATQMLKGYVENFSTWGVEIQMLKCSMVNVSSQIQMLSSHLENASVDIQMVKGELKDANSLIIQIQILRSSLQGASDEIQRLNRDLEKANVLNSQTQSFLKSSSESTSIELHILRSSLERANDEIQKLKGGLQNANAANSQTQTFVRGSLEKSSAEIQLLKRHLERAGDEMHSLKTDLEKAMAQSQMINNCLEQTNAQVQVLKAEVKVTNALNSQIQVLNGHLENASSEIQTLKRGMRDTAALKAQTRTLGSSLQNASAEIQRLKGDLENNTKNLTAKIQGEQSRLEMLSTAFASQEQLQKTQNQLLQLILQGWVAYGRSLYYFSNDKKYWNEAEKFCVSQGAHLASVTSEEEQAFLTKSTSTSYHWIGLTDRGMEGSWRWADGTPFNAIQSRAFWDKNQPDNWLHHNGQTEDCVHIQQMWNDMYCDAAYHWVCKK